jgi:membrane protein
VSAGGGAGGAGGGGWHRSVTGIARRTLEAAFEDNIPFLASALSFDLLLTVIPFVALLLAVVGYLVQHQITTQQVDLHELLGRLLPSTAGGVPEAAFTQVERALAGVVRQRVRLTAVGLPLFLWFSTRLFGGLRAALNEVFDTDERRPWPMAKLLDLAMVLSTGTLLVVGALLTTWEARNAAVLGRSFALDWLWRLSLELIAFGLGVVLFFTIFKLLPSRHISWRTALVAAVFCALGFEVAKRLYALYVIRFATLDRVASDANIVALLLFLLWVYYTAYLFLLGGEVAEMYDLIRMQRSQRVRLG